MSLRLSSTLIGCLHQGSLQKHFVSGQVALIVGGELSGNSISSVEIFSPEGGCQYSLTALPLPLTGLTLGLRNTDVFACSGYDTTTRLNNQKCWRYSILGNHWVLVGQLALTKPKYPAKSFQSNLYFINDEPGEYYSLYSGVVPWTTRPPSTLGEGACSIIWGSAMVIFGGGIAKTAVQMFDFYTSTWKILAPMTMAHAFFGCVLLPDSNLVLVVSTTPGGNEKRSDIYDLVNNTWNVTGSTVNPRAGTSLVALGKRVFAIGGNSAPYPTSLSATVEEYNIKMGTWSLVQTPLLNARVNFAALSLPAVIFSYLPQGCMGVQ